MSSSTVTIVVPTAENETVFILHAVQAALKAYRKSHNRSDQRSGQVDANSLDRTTDEADKKTGTFGQPTSTIV
jgi:hypothetical protein